MEQQATPPDRVPALTAWERMRWYKKIAFVIGVLAIGLSLVSMVWALPDKPTVAMSSLVTICIATVSCYFAVKYGDQP